MIFQILAEVQLNISSILNNFKSLLKKVCQKEWRTNVKKRNYQNSYFGAEISKKEQELIRVKVKKNIDS